MTVIEVAFAPVTQAYCPSNQKYKKGLTKDAIDTAWKQPEKIMLKEYPNFPNVR